jgi:hypothetical protein
MGLGWVLYGAARVGLPGLFLVAAAHLIVHLAYLALAPLRLPRYAKPSAAPRRQADGTP